MDIAPLTSAGNNLDNLTIEPWLYRAVVHLPLIINTLLNNAGRQLTDVCQQLGSSQIYTYTVHSIFFTLLL